MRRELVGAGAKWTVLGQSFGGFCLLTYLSTHPEALKAGLFTGGLPPVGRTPDEVIPDNQEIMAPIASVFEHSKACSRSSCPPFSLAENVHCVFFAPSICAQRLGGQRCLPRVGLMPVDYVIER